MKAKHPFGIPPFKAPESWSKKAILHVVKQSDALIGIKVQTLDETFTIPIIDVRNGYSQRERAEEMVKANSIQNGSKYFKPSYSVLGYSYNNSRKL